ncbi:MAG: alpha/beta fold hydrolase [Oscillospiraceae bacterium]|jgi:carboxylesterase|nr:alpha/beta fold hydrolase [Oscillospiraceae bacterium]
MHTPEFTRRGEPLVVFIHGFMGSPDQFSQLRDDSARLGASTLTILLPGHGGTARDFVTHGVRDWERHLYNQLSQYSQGFERVYLVGHSMGGLLSLLASAKPRHHIRGVMLLSTPLRVNIFNPHANIFRLKLLRALVNAQIGRGDSTPLDDAAVLHVYETALSVGKPRGLYGIAFLRPAFEFERLVIKARRNLAAVTVPCVLVHSRADETAHFSSADDLYRGLANAAKTRIVLDRSSHSYYDADEREIVKTALKAMIAGA